MIPTIKDYPKDKTHYEHFADDAYYIFLQKHAFFLDVPHYHDSIEILCVTKGKTTVHLNGATYDLSEGEIFVSNSQMVHYYENYDDDKMAIIVVLSEKYMRTFKEVYKNALLPHLLRDKQANAQIFSIMESWINSQNRSILIDTAYANALFDKIISLYGVISVDQVGGNNDLAIQFINYVNEHYSEEISLETAAKHFGYSKEYFSKKFKQTLDKNFLSFLNAVRLQKAIELLQDKTNKMSFIEICLACGFNNATSLYRHLKKANYKIQRQDVDEDDEKDGL
ncbi:MAG: helix-turn-helix domain-containing protein [Clostridia bacterium]|nr:helix-turn-helix domain-containing protein [Clostridia bacterium]